jgi:hypothetical protein
VEKGAVKTLAEMRAAAAGESSEPATIQERPSVVAPAIKPGKVKSLAEMRAAAGESLSVQSFAPATDAPSTGGDRFLGEEAYKREKITPPANKELGEPLKNRLAALTDDPRAEKNRLDAAELLAQVTPLRLQ